MQPCIAMPNTGQGKAVTHQAHHGHALGSRPLPSAPLQPAVLALETTPGSHRSEQHKARGHVINEEGLSCQCKEVNAEKSHATLRHK